MQANDKKITLKSRIKSFGYAITGLKTLISSEPNAKIHLTVAVLVTLAGFLLKISSGEWIGIVICIALVLSMEAINTAIEYLCDFCSEQYSPYIEKSKDLAAAAVLLSTLGAVLVGVIIFLPKILALI